MRRAEEGKIYRQNKREAMGEVAYKAQEALKRKNRRAEAKARAQTEEKAPEPEQNNDAAIISSFNESVEEDKLLNRVYKAKVKQNAALTPPRTIKLKSVEQQLDKVKLLHRKLNNSELTDFKFLKDTTKIINFVNSQWNTPDSRNSQFQAISSILSVYATFKKEYTFYSNLSIANRKDINKAKGDNLKTPAEQENMMKWEELKGLPLLNTMKSQERAIVALYTQLPPRRAEDVSLIVIGATDEPDQNSLLLDAKGNPESVLYRKFKTDKTYPAITINIPKELSTILAKYIKQSALKTGDPLFGTANKTHYQNFSEVVSKAFKSHTGKNITINTLRHSFITDFLSKNQSDNAKKGIATMMGNSINIQSQYNRVN